MNSKKASPSQELTCHSCGGRARWRGRIPDAARFAGRYLDAPLPGGGLYACESCRLNFRFPRLPKQTLDELYVRGAADTWEADDGRRPDWALAREFLMSASVPKTVLDVGCFDGGFLDSLGAGWDRYGIEIHPDAAGRAAQRGVAIVSNDIDELDRLDAEFGVVTALDLIEHVEDPLLVLKQLSRLARRGGLVIVSTGNTEAGSWMLLGSRYYYCAIPEHVSFINPLWCAYAAEKLDLTLVDVAQFSHQAERGLVRRARQAALNMIYAFLPGLMVAARSLGLGGFDARRQRYLRDYPPNWGAARDHLLACFRK
ncbi:MAG: class I SAM-dependent methyltransferase [Gemmatimonadota bacterium]|nr:MAG: class I SAM-dependent methyltransferase [Gemmatimonadota bacterium]